MLDYRTEITIFLVSIFVLAYLGFLIFDLAKDIDNEISKDKKCGY